MLVLSWHTLNMMQKNVATRAANHVCGKRNHGKKRKMIGILGNQKTPCMVGIPGILVTQGQPGTEAVMMKAQIGREVETPLNAIAGEVAEQISGMTRTGKGTVTMIGQMIDEMFRKKTGMSSGKEVVEVVLGRIGKGETTTMMTEEATKRMTSMRNGEEIGVRSLGMTIANQTGEVTVTTIGGTSGGGRKVMMSGRTGGQTAGATVTAPGMTTGTMTVLATGTVTVAGHQAEPPRTLTSMTMTGGATEGTGTVTTDHHRGTANLTAPLQTLGGVMALANTESIGMLTKWHLVPTMIRKAMEELVELVATTTTLTGGTTTITITMAMHHAQATAMAIMMSYTEPIQPINSKWMLTTLG